MRRKSFELNYNGGTIWCEHLDGMGACEAEAIAAGLLESDKAIRKIAFVGVPGNRRKAFGGLKRNGIAIRFLSDYEKAKEWLFAGPSSAD